MFKTVVTEFAVYAMVVDWLVPNGLSFVISYNIWGRMGSGSPCIQCIYNIDQRLRVIRLDIHRINLQSNSGFAEKSVYKRMPNRIVFSFVCRPTYWLSSK